MNDLETWLRWISVPLQLFGVIVAAIAIVGLRHEFGIEPGPAWRWVTRMRSAVRRRFGRPTGRIIEVSAAGMSITGGSARVALNFTEMDERALTREQLRRLDSQVRLIAATVEELEERVGGLNRSLSSRIHDEARARIEADDAALDRHRRTAAGNLAVQEAGLGLLIAGIVLATVPAEVADAIRAVVPWI